MKNFKSQILHLGCGYSKFPGSIGVDMIRKSDADVIHNLDKFPYPFKNNTFKKIIAENILEHLEDITKTMEEIYRISQNGAQIIITSSHFSSVDSFNDPTHKHFFTTRSFDYYIPGTDLYKYQYSKAKFKKVNVRMGPKKSNNFLLNSLLDLINNHTLFFEKRLAFIFPVGVIYFELKVIKAKNGKN